MISKKKIFISYNQHKIVALRTAPSHIKYAMTKLRKKKKKTKDER